MEIDLSDHLHDEALKVIGDREIHEVEDPYFTIAVIFAAQGVIDNGGFRYFFENDWPKNPPYSIFYDAYDRIGLQDEAKNLKDAVLSFGINGPERQIELRNKYIDENYDEDKFEVKGWNDTICGNEFVWDKLVLWVKDNHPQVFENITKKI